MDFKVIRHIKKCSKSTETLWSMWSINSKLAINIFEHVQHFNLLPLLRNLNLCLVVTTPLFFVATLFICLLIYLFIFGTLFFCHRFIFFCRFNFFVVALLLSLRFVVYCHRFILLSQFYFFYRFAKKKIRKKLKNGDKKYEVDSGCGFSGFQ